MPAGPSPVLTPMKVCRVPKAGSPVSSPSLRTVQVRSNVWPLMDSVGASTLSVTRSGTTAGRGSIESVVLDTIQLFASLPPSKTRLLPSVHSTTVSRLEKAPAGGTTAVTCKLGSGANCTLIGSPSTATLLFSPPCSNTQSHASVRIITYRSPWIVKGSVTDLVSV